MNDYTIAGLDDSIRSNMMRLMHLDPRLNVTIIGMPEFVKDTRTVKSIPPIVEMYLTEARQRPVHIYEEIPLTVKYKVFNSLEGLQIALVGICEHLELLISTIEYLESIEDNEHDENDWDFGEDWESDEDPDDYN